MAIFDPSTVEETSAYPVAAPGTYRALVENAEVKPNKAGTGKYVQVNMSIIDPAEKGVKVMAWLNFENQNIKAQQIGRAQLKRFLASVGINTAIDLDDVARHTKNKVTVIEVEVEDGPKGPQNRVAAFLAPQASQPAPARSVPHPADDSVPF